MPDAKDRSPNTPYLFRLQHPTTLQKRRILIVEDEALVAMLIEDFLRDAGAEIVGTAGSVAEALPLIERVTSDGGLDGAVLDIHLEGGSVTPVANLLAELGVPFLFATGYDEERDRGEHIAAPVLHKPFAYAKLVSAVAEITKSGTRTSGEPCLEC